MHWDNRIIKQTTIFKKGDVEDKDISFSIHEVFYNRQGEITGRTERPIGIIGDTVEELRSAYKMLEEAFDKDILIDEDIVYKNYLPEKFSWEELIHNISFQLTPFDWGHSIFTTKKVKSEDDDYVFRMVSGFKLGPIMITW